VVLNSGDSLSSVEESDVLEESSDLIDLHDNLGGVLLSLKSLYAHSSVSLSSEVNELGEEISNVEDHSIDREVILGVGSLNLRDRQVSELLGENGNEDGSHLRERLLNDEEIGSSLFIESKVGSELVKLGREVLSNRVVVDVVVDKCELIEDIVEVRSVLSLEEVLSLMEELSSIL